MRPLRSERGDTIVEVLIAIAIASFVIGGSYSVVNRSLKQTQQAQEHAEALLLANTQVELIGHYIRTHDATTLAQTLYSSSTKFHCFNPTSTAFESFSQITSLPDSNASHYTDPLVPGPGCDKAGTVDYRVAFEYDDAGTPAPHQDDIYRVYVNWASITGGTDDQVRVVYKAGT